MSPTYNFILNAAVWVDRCLWTINTMVFLLEHPRGHFQILIQKGGLFCSSFFSIRLKKKGILNGSKVHGDNIFYSYMTIFLGISLLETWQWLNKPPLNELYTNYFLIQQQWLFSMNTKKNHQQSKHSISPSPKSLKSKPGPSKQIYFTWVIYPLKFFDGKIDNF